MTNVFFVFKVHCNERPPVQRDQRHGFCFSRARILSGVTFSCGHKNYWSIFEILAWHYSNMVMCKWIFKDATEIQNGRQRSTPKKFVGAKTLKLNVRNYSNFTITFPTIWRCACDFFKVLRKLKMAAMLELHYFLLTQKRKKMKSEIMSRWFYWNLKWPPQVDFLNICDRNNSNLIYGGGWYRTLVLLLINTYLLMTDHWCQKVVPTSEICGGFSMIRFTVIHLCPHCISRTVIPTVAKISLSFIYYKIDLPLSEHLINVKKTVPRLR